MKTLKNRQKTLLVLGILMIFIVALVLIGIVIVSSSASEIMEVLEKYSINSNSFSMNILVTKEYYDSIKENFPNRIPDADHIITEYTEKWSISLLYPFMMTNKSD